MSGFFGNCVVADEKHLSDCDCCNSVVDEKLLVFAKSDSDLQGLCDSDLLLKLKGERCNIIKHLGAENRINNVRCKHEVDLVNGIVDRFKDFDLTIPTYAVIVIS